MPSTKAQRQKVIRDAQARASRSHHSVSARVAPAAGWEDPASGLTADRYGVVIPGGPDQVIAADRLGLPTLVDPDQLPTAAKQVPDDSGVQED